MMTDQAAPELLPCPFCGEGAAAAYIDNRTGQAGSVVCLFCDAGAPSVSAWNRRADLAAPSALVDDGRPMNTDVFLGRLYEACDDFWERSAAINEWLHGDWPAALKYLEDAV